MAKERHLRAAEIFLKICDMDHAERKTELERACGDDAALCEDVLSILRHDRAALHGLGTEALAGRVLAVAAEVEPSRGMPERVGPYRILELLGRGGMGEVYVALQEQPVRREVALKLVRAGYDTEEFVSRFEAERQVLALMDHPNVAKVLDAGASEDGLPYFVMDRIKGVPITEYCRRNNVGMRDRLAMFRDICRGVAHAHGRGVIHRDLKPSNVLVSDVEGLPVPKVIDFGVAKTLGESATDVQHRTRTGQIIGTLEYMSPEQARGEIASIDVRSDVYSLGVILYELLTGRRPFDLEDTPFHEAVRRISESPPTSPRSFPSIAGAKIPADVETIVVKCLEKDPQRRYDGAAALADDVDRYLDSRPILARPPSVLYQLGKLASRHRVAFGFATLVFVFVVAFAITVSVQLGIQSRERARAEGANRTSQRVSRFLQDMLESGTPEKGELQVTVREILDRSAESIGDELQGEPEVEAAIRETIGISYRKLGENDASEEQLLHALELRRDLTGDSSVEAGNVHFELANTRVFLGRFEEALGSIERALEIHRNTPDLDPRLVVADLNTLGVIQRRLGNADAAVQTLRGSIEIFRALEDLTKDDKLTLSVNAENLAGALIQRGELEEAEQLVHERVDLLRQADRSEGPGMATSLHNLAFVMRAQGKYAEAVTMFQQSSDMDKRVLGEASPGVAHGLRSLGHTLLLTGRLTEAEAVLRESFEMLVETTSEDSIAIGLSRAGLAIALARLGRAAEAEDHAREAVRIMRAAGEGQVPALVSALVAEAEAHECGSRWNEAETVHREALAVLEEKFEEGRPARVDAEFRLAAFLARRGRFEEAEALSAAVVERRREKLGERHPSYAFALATHARVVEGLGDRTMAEGMYREALAILRPLLGDAHTQIAAIELNLARCLREEGDAAAALALARSALKVQRETLGDAHPAVAAAREEVAESLAAVGSDAN